MVTESWFKVGIWWRLLCSIQERKGSVDADVKNTEEHYSIVWKLSPKTRRMTVFFSLFCEFLLSKQWAAGEMQRSRFPAFRWLKVAKFLFKA